MIDLTLDVQQYDCPFIDTTDDHAVSFTASDWAFDPDAQELETRMVVDATDRGALTAGLEALCAHEHLHDCRLVAKRGDTAEIATTIHETSAMRTIRDNGGSITGPFYIEDGSERWHVGFTDDRSADHVLAELDRDNDFTVESREAVDNAVLGETIRNAEAARAVLDAARELTDTERRTLEAAVAEGYFESPRGITLSELADRFDVSKPAVSKNLRRGQRKVLERAVRAVGSD